MSDRLVPWPRSTVLAVVGASTAVVLILAVLVHDNTRANWFDNDIYRAISAHVPLGALNIAVHLTDVPLVAGLFVSLAIVAGLFRRWDVTALAICAPTFAVLITEAVLKPLVHRSHFVSLATSRVDEQWAYPSGHETGLATLAIVFGLLLLGSGVRTGYKIAWCLALAGAVVAGAVALVGYGYHFATDTVGAVGVSLSVTLTVALIIDGVTSRIPRELESAVSR